MAAGTVTIGGARAGGQRGGCVAAGTVTIGGARAGGQGRLRWVGLCLGASTVKFGGRGGWVRVGRAGRAGGQGWCGVGWVGLCL